MAGCVFICRPLPVAFVRRANLLLTGPLVAVKRSGYSLQLPRDPDAHALRSDLLITGTPSGFCSLSG